METNSNSPEAAGVAAEASPNTAPADGTDSSPPVTNPPPPGPFDGSDAARADSPPTGSSGDDDQIIDLQATAESPLVGGAETQPATQTTAVLTTQRPSGDTGGDQADVAGEPGEALWQQRLNEVQAQAAAWEHARDRTLELEGQVADQRREVTDRLEAHNDRMAAMERRQAEAIEQLNSLGAEVKAEIKLSGIATERQQRFGDHAELRSTVRTLLRRLSDGREIDDDDRRQLLTLGHRTGDHWLSDAGRAVVAWALGDETRGDTAAERAMSTEEQPARWFLAAVAFTQPDLADRRGETLTRAIERADPASSPVALDLAELALGGAAGSQGSVRAADLLTGWAGEPPGDPVRQDGWVRRVARTATDVSASPFERLAELERWDDLRTGLKALTVGEALSSRLDERDRPGLEDRDADTSSSTDAVNPEPPGSADGDLVARQHLLATIDALIEQPEPDEAELIAQELDLRDQVGRTQTVSRPRVPDLPDHDRLLWSLALDEGCDELGPRSTEVLKRTGRRWLATALSEHLSVARSMLPDQVNVSIGELEPLTLQRPDASSAPTSKPIAIGPAGAAPIVAVPADSVDTADGLVSQPEAELPVALDDADTSPTNDRVDQLERAMDEADGPEPTARPIGALDAIGLVIAIAGVVLALTVSPWAWIAVGVGLAIFVIGMVVRRRRAAQRRRQRDAARSEARGEFAAIWADWEAYWARVDAAEAANSSLLGRLTSAE